MFNSHDVVEIISLINRYALAVDCQSWDLFDQIFTPDIEADFGPGAAWTDLASLRQAFDAIHSIFKATQHITTNHQVVVEGDRATAVSYVHGRFIRQISEADHMFESTGWYDDRLVRTPAGWRIRKRVCHMVWHGGNLQVFMPTADAGTTLQSKSLREEAQAGRVDILTALNAG